jgi:hypothetical protein
MLKHPQLVVHIPPEFVHPGSSFLPLRLKRKDVSQVRTFLQTMRARLIIAMAIGAFISMIFLTIPSMRDGTSSWASLELPGMIAALLAGPDSSDILSLVIMGTVNAVVYGLVAFVVILAIP